MTQITRRLCAFFIAMLPLVANGAEPALSQWVIHRRRPNRSPAPGLLYEQGYELSSLWPQ